MPCTKMEEILTRCNETIDYAAKKDIPPFVWKTCKGIAIINVSETGFIFSAADGDGVVLKRNDDGSWGAPSALMYTGCSGGVVFGKANKKILLFPMTEHGLKMLTANTKFQLGAQIGLAAGPYGREASAALDAGGKGVGATFSYVFEEGVFVNVGINDNFIDTVKELNEAFYGKEANATDIVMEAGAVSIPESEGLKEMHAKLGALSKGKESEEAKEEAK